MTAESPLTYEEQILAEHSTPGLRQGELNRQAKKEQLNAQGMSKFPADRDKILDELYGPEETPDDAKPE